MNHSAEIQITDHAYKRAKSRFGLKPRSIDSLAEKAFFEGLKHADTKGKLKKYISGLWLQYKTADNIRVYGENIFLFTGHRLITVYRLPQELRKYIKI